MLTTSSDTRAVNWAGCSASATHDLQLHPGTTRLSQGSLPGHDRDQEQLPCPSLFSVSCLLICWPKHIMCLNLASGHPTIIVDLNGRKHEFRTGWRIFQHKEKCGFSFRSNRKKKHSANMQGKKTNWSPDHSLLLCAGQQAAVLFMSEKVNARLWSMSKAV